MTQPAPPFHRMIVVVDVEGFTAPDRHLPDRLAMRQGMYGVLKTAFAECDVDFDACKTEDRGDGALILLSPETSKTAVVDRLPDRVAVALRRYNSSRIPQAQMRLRVSLNSGEVLFDGKGWVGEAIDTAFRILEARLAKEALAESDHIVAFISTDRFFDDVIAPDPGLLPELYTPIPVSVKTFTGTAYLRLHGEPAAPIPAPSTPSPPRTDDTIPAEASEALLDVIPHADLASLREQLTAIEVPQLAVMLSRALGPAVRLPPLDRISNAWDALCLLTDYTAGPDGIPPAITFLRLLAGRVGGELGATLTNWVGEQGRQLRLGPALEQQKEIRLPIPANPHLHLTIMLEPVSADPAQCTLVFWRQDDPQVWPPALGGVREIGIDELELRVDDVIVDAESVWAGQRISVAVEFLLPRELINLPVQRWAKEHSSGQPQPLRYAYLLGIRSLERMRSRHWHRAWHVRWDSMLGDPSADRLHYPGGAQFEEYPIDAVLSDDRWVGLVLAKPPRPRPDPGELPDELTSGLRVGLPLIVWHPEAEPEELRELLKWMLDGSSLMNLLDRRKTAISATTNLPIRNYLAHNLVVLWDDPDRPIG